MTRYRVTFLLAAAIAALLLLFSHQSQVGDSQAQGRTGLVLAFYYAWYNPGSFGPGKTAFQPPEPYTSGDPGTIQRHVNQARSAGIDGFVQSWYGPADPYTNGNFQTLLDTAAASGFKAAIDFEPATLLSNNDERANALKYLLETHATHPAYLRMDGKPVIFFWANWAYSVEDWAYIRSIADPNHNSIWIAEGANTEYLSVFDGLHLYNTAWAANPAGIASTWGANTRAASETYGAFKYWVATAMPGFDDRHLGRGDASVYRDRAGGAYYQNSFAAAAASDPDLLIITSFNEWAEGSNIEPSVEFGNHYLELTSQLVAGYKSGGVAAPPPLPESTTPPTTQPSQTQPQPTTESQAQPSPASTAASASTTALPTADPQGRIIYEVASGDTLSAIAFRFDVTLEELYRYNELDENSLLSVGQPLIVGFEGGEPPEGALSSLPISAAPLPAGVEVRDDGMLVYRVEEGDTLLAIAVRNDLTMEEMLALNEGLTEESFLQIGQEIVVGERRQPQSTGGSTDLPQEAATATPEPLPTTPPTATATITPQPTPTEAAQTASNRSTSSDLPPLPSPTSQPEAQQNEADSENGTSSGWDWLPLTGAALILVGLTGSVFYYLGNRQRPL
jgi:LysM repeat protein